ncbi:MAG: DNA-processing protein DprA [Campylobacterota bacterium]|nr:DNA-processing protein DprA [Campylobacterota bacterium]
MKLIDIAILTNIKGLGSINMIKILNYCKAQNINSIYELQNISLFKVVSIKLADIIALYLDADIDNLYNNMENLIDSYKENDIYCICINDDKYPDLLKESTNPPVILYCKGDRNLLSSKCVAVIGTRENSSIGEKLTVKTTEFLTQNDFTIVSGLATGIDEIAHKITLQNSGKTIAVLPTIDTIYPASNKQLAQDILDNGGLLISENKPNTRFNSGLLVKRDRIQSGLSRAVFTIESSLKGGSLHASNDAVKLNRNLYTPDIYKLSFDYQSSKQVEGIKNLIDLKKATPYSKDNYSDILKEINTIHQKDTLW